MASTTFTVSLPSGGPYIDGLMYDSDTSNTTMDVRIWDVSSPITWFLAPGDADSSGVDDWAENASTAAVSTAFDQIAAVCGLVFEQVFTAAEANLSQIQADLGGSILGQSQLPQADNTIDTQYNNFQSVFTAENNAVGGYSYITFIHEIGHSLGLDHPHGANGFPGVSSSGDTGDNGLNQGVWTMMTYIDGWDGDGGTPTDDYGWEGSPMAFDIAALQYLYGANTAAAAGNSSYVLPTVNAPGTYYSCIWDTGGRDTIRAGVGAGDTVINLNDATLLNAPGGGGYISRVDGIFGGLTIANGVVIENAVGGNGDDTLVGNEADNVLSGGAGADSLDGGIGNDTYVLGADSDDVVDTGGTADAITTTVNRSLAGYATIEGLTLQGAATTGTGNALANRLTGNDLGNVLNGVAGADALYGGTGHDTLYGSGDADTRDVLLGGLDDDVYVTDRADVVAEAAGEGTDAVWATQAVAVLAANVEILRLFGAGALVGVGNGLANSIYGNGGNNTLEGGGGVDTVAGGAGNDVYRTDGTDRLFEVAGQGSDSVVASGNAILAANLENLTLVGGAVAGFGNEDANAITGNALGNQLRGLGGSDTISGGGGNDTIIGGAAGDLLTGGGTNDIFRYLSASESAPAGNDRITDFDAFGNDRIDLAAVFGPTLSFIGSGAFTAVGQVRAVEVAGPNVLVEVNTGAAAGAEMRITLLGTSLAAVDELDFIL